MRAPPAHDVHLTLLGKRMIEAIFGSGKDLDAIQMAARAFALFFVTLALIRVAGMRAFGRKSSFDTIIVIMLGAVLSRAVVGASPVVPIVSAAAVLVVLHRAVAMITARWPLLERLLKGTTRRLYRDGVLDTRAMHLHGISRSDLEETIRDRRGSHALGAVREIHFESSGELTVLDDVDTSEPSGDAAPAR